MSVDHFSRKEAEIRCVDCACRLSEKSIQRTARGCVKCTHGPYLVGEGRDTRDQSILQVLSCLECCVDIHDGHGFTTRLQMENEQMRAVEDQSRLLEMAKSMAESVRKHNELQVRREIKDHHPSFHSSFRILSLDWHPHKNVL